ncbi:MAG: anti-sigma factor family protein [Chloroflexota bacterium]
MADGSDRHASHDPALVASLFDGDLADSDLATAQLWVATCPSCAALHADLLALSQATRRQPTPARARDFRLTAEDAARLRAEPVAADARLSGVMTDRTEAAQTAHASHDTILVASLADHSLPEAERGPAQDLVASCAECAALHADLIALVAATRAMPTPPRPIDYTLTRGHAARLRPNPWRRLAAAVGSAHDGLTRPLAMGLTALGLVGVLVASAPTILQPSAETGGSTATSQGIAASEPIVDAAPAAGAADTSGEAAGAAPIPTEGALAAASAAPDRAGSSVAPVFGAAAAPAASQPAQPVADGIEKGTLPGPSVSPPDDTAAVTTTAPRPASANGLLIVSVVLLIAGVGLFLLRWGARRLTDG